MIDGGRVVSTVHHPVEAAEKIASYSIELARRKPGVTMRGTVVNGQPGSLGREDGIIVTVHTFAMSGGHNKRIWAGRSREELVPWTAEHFDATP